MSEHKEPIPSMIYNASVGGHVTSSQQIIDENENKEQSQINAEVKEALGTGGSVDARIEAAFNEEKTRAERVEEALDGRVDTLEEAVGTGGSIDSRIEAAKSEIKGNATSACDTLGEAEALISAEKTRAQSTEENLRTLYNNLQQSQPVPVTALPATGEAGKIYRLAGTTSYADYMYAEGALTTPIKMAEYDNAIDDEPTAGSDNLVKSKGVYNIISQIIADNSKVNEYVSELYIVSPNGNKVDGIYVSSLQYSAEDGFTIILSKNGTEVASTFRKKNLSAGDVVEMQIRDETYSNYRFLFVYSGNTSTYGATGVHWYLTNNVFNLRCWLIIANFLTSKIGKVELIDLIPTENSNNPVKSSGIYTSINATKTALETQIATKQNKPVVCDNANANKHIIEMYIEKGYREGLYLYLVQFGNGDRRFAIYDSNGEVASVNKAAAVANTVYKFENDSITLYWVWSGQEGISISGIHYNLTDDVKNILNWPNIYSYIQEHSGDEVVMNWTDNAQCNQHIKELYINPEYYVDGLKLKTIVVRQKSMSFMLYDSSNNLVYNNSCDWPTIPTINNEIPYNDLMWPIYTAGIDGKLIGYIKFRYLNDNYGVSGINYTLTQSIVTNINNSPTAKAIINAKDQFVMFGDSLIGQPLNTHNLMIPYLINKLKVPVYDIGCGGCRMSLRTPGATDYYDSFSFTKIVDAFISGELDENQQNPTGATSYVGQIRNLQLIDKTKNIVAICEYLNNDFNSPNLLGDYFVANTEEFDINSFNKQTVLGAMNYGVSKLLMNLPEIKLGMINGAYTMANNGIEGLNDFQKTADGNKTLIDYQKAIFTNATKIGIPYIDMNNMPTGRNFFNLRMSQFNTVDGTHCNAYGFIQLAKVMVMAYEHISGNRIS